MYRPRSYLTNHQVRAAVEIIMDEGGVDDEEDDDEIISEHASELSGEEEGSTDGEDHDEIDHEIPHEDSIIDMLEEQHMEEQVDRGDGWTTDTDSIEEEEEEMDDEEDANDELIEFPAVQFHSNAGDDVEDDGVDYSEEEMDEEADIEGFREMVGNLHGQFFPDGEEDEEDEEDEDEDDHHHHDHLHYHGGIFSVNARPLIRHGGPGKCSFQYATHCQFHCGLGSFKTTRESFKREGVSSKTLMKLIYSYTSSFQCIYSPHDGQRASRPSQRTHEPSRQPPCPIGTVCAAGYFTLNGTTVRHAKCAQRLDEFIERWRPDINLTRVEV